MFSHDEDNDFDLEQRIAAKQRFFADILNSNSNDLNWDVDKLGRINSDDLKNLDVHIKQNTCITSLGLSCNKLGQNKELMTLLVNLLEDNSQIKSIDLSLNFINTESIDIILQSDKLRPRLKDINFSFVSNIIDDEGYKKSFENLSVASIRSIIFGNRLKDMDYINSHYPDNTLQSEVLSSPSQNYANSSTSIGSNNLSDSSNERGDERKEQTQQGESATIIGSAIPKSYFFSKTVTPRTSDSSSQPSSPPTSGKTSNTSTPPDEEIIKHSRKLSNSRDSTD